MLNSKIKMMAVASFMALNAVAEMDGNLAADDMVQKIKLSLQAGSKGVGLTAGYQIKPWLSIHGVGTFALLMGKEHGNMNMWSAGAESRLHMFSDAPEFYVGAHIGYADMGGKLAKVIQTKALTDIEQSDNEDAKKASLRHMKIGLTTGYSLAISQSMGVGFNLGLFRTGKADAKANAMFMKKDDSKRTAAIKAAFGEGTDGEAATAKWTKSNMAEIMYRTMYTAADKAGGISKQKIWSYGFDMFGQRFQPAASISLDMSF